MSPLAAETPPATTTWRPARIADPNDLPWTPLTAGLSFKPLRFLKDDRGWVALLRLEPGTVIPLHQHTGELHAMNLEGQRQLATGEIIGPGGYVYEPAGNIDTWKAVGETPLVVLIVVTGAVEYLGPDGQVMVRASAVTQRVAYEQHCAATGLAALDLDE